MMYTDERWNTSIKRRIIAGVSGSLGSLAALHHAVAEARRGDCEVLAVLAWEPPGGEHGYRLSPCPPLLAEVRKAAVERLRTAIGEAFGADGPDVDFGSVVIRGETGKALIHLADRPDDLLVLGASGSLLRRGLRRSVVSYCVEHAVCPVLAVPRPALQHELESLRRRHLWHLPTEPLPTS
ncbi:universal stress protein [Kitasatospora acidiphila]|nr:universal stress protein [Kitasatospora acidiphila]